LNKKLGELLLILFAPAVIFWGCLGFYNLMFYGSKNEFGDINDLIIGLKESVNDDLSRTD
jgi:hypothetical protein